MCLDAATDQAKAIVRWVIYSGVIGLAVFILLNWKGRI